MNVSTSFLQLDRRSRKIFSIWLWTGTLAWEENSPTCLLFHVSHLTLGDQVVSSDSRDRVANWSSNQSPRLSLLCGKWHACLMAKSPLGPEKKNSPLNWILSCACSCSPVGNNNGCIFFFSFKNLTKCNQNQTNGVQKGQVLKQGIRSRFMSRLSDEPQALTRVILSVWDNFCVWLNGFMRLNWNGNGKCICPCLCSYFMRSFPPSFCLMHSPTKICLILRSFCILARAEDTLCVLLAN